MRTRKVTVDDDIYTVGALTLEQVERFIAPIEDINGTDSAKIRSYELVCFGLNNGAKNGSEAEAWTKERVYKELDLVTFSKLQHEILDLSGLKVKSELPKGAEPGEEKNVLGEAPTAVQ